MTKKDGTGPSRPKLPVQDNKIAATDPVRLCNLKDCSGILGSILSLLAQISARNAVRSGRKTARVDTRVSPYRGYRIAIGGDERGFHIVEICTDASRLTPPRTVLGSFDQALALAKGLIDMQVQGESPSI